MTSGRAIPRPQPTRARPPAPTDPVPAPPDAVGEEIERAGGELAALVPSIRSCEACSRSSDARAFGSGHPRAPVMLLKDAPAPADLETETAFAEEGDALAKAFGELRIPVSWVYGTTAVRCGADRVSLDAVKACAGHLLVELEAIEPQVLVVFGGTALEAVRALDGRCGLRVPDEIPRSEAVSLRPGLRMLLTEPLPEGLRDRDAKRRLWTDLRLLPGWLAAETESR